MPDILARMDATLAALDRHWSGKRRPKAFYLVPDDWSAFMATNPPTVRTMFGNNPPQSREDPAFREIPVRESTGKASRLYDNTTTGRNLADA